MCLNSLSETLRLAGARASPRGIAGYKSLEAHCRMLRRVPFSDESCRGVRSLDKRYCLAAHTTTRSNERRASPFREMTEPDHRARSKKTIPRLKSRAAKRFGPALM